MSALGGVLAVAFYTSEIEVSERQKQELQDRVQAIADVGTDLLIVRDGVNDDAISMLREAGIVTYRRVERDDLELISRACGASIVRDTRGINPESLGTFESNRICIPNQCQT